MNLVAEGKNQSHHFSVFTNKCIMEEIEIIHIHDCKKISRLSLPLQRQNCCH